LPLKLKRKEALLGEISGLQELILPCLGNDDPSTPTVAADPDVPVLVSSPALILRAGVTELQNLPNTPQLGVPDLGTDFTSSGVPLSQGNIRVGDIDTSSSDGNGGPVVLSATGNITAGNIITTTVSQGQPQNIFQGGSVNISATGNIEVKDITTTLGDVDIVGASIITGNIDTFLSPPSAFDVGDVRLESISGDLVVDSIKAADDITITAAGLFRSEGTFDYSFSFNNAPESPILVRDSPELIEFFISQGFSREDVENSQAEVFIFPSQSTSPVSLAALSNNNSRIIIRYGGASGSDNGGLIQIQGGSDSSDFVVGPLDTPVAGQEFVYRGTPLNSDEPFPNMDSDSIFLQRNVASSISLNNLPDRFPANVSGTAGAIVVGGGVDATLNQSLRNRPFEPTLPGDGQPVVTNPPDVPISDPDFDVPISDPGLDLPTSDPGGGGGSDPVVTDPSGSDDSSSGTTQLAAQLFEQQDERSPKQPNPPCQRPEEQLETLTDPSNRPKQEECEELEPLQQNAPNLLRLELEPPAGSDSQFAPSNLPRSSLPEQLTGGELGNATEVKVNSDGQLELSGSEVESQSAD
jgi:hypothetical protein